MLFKILLALAAFCIGRMATANEVCDVSQNGLMKYEERVLVAADLFAKHHDSRNLLKITEPLACILEIQENGEGSIKYFANSFLRPIFGGPQINGVPKDRRYKIIADELTKISSHTKIDQSIFAAHSRGSWGFYTLFCEQGNIEFCATMLPDENQVTTESPLLAASSMIMLRKAYYLLQGKQKDEVAARIKQIYRTLPL
ncbi:MAG: hypothetical protein ACXVA9_09400, partial [Bdellovibrionales bacterium]